MLLKITTLLLALGHAAAQWCTFPPQATNLEGINGLSLRHFINPDENTLSMELTYQGTGWVGVGFSDSGQMNGANPAIIGVPGAATEVGLYDLGLNGPATLLWSGQDRLMDTSVTQDYMKTVLAFTIPITDGWSSLVEAGSSKRIIYAVGSSNNLIYGHAQSSSTMVDFENCNPNAVSPPTAGPTPIPPPTAAPTPVPPPTTAPTPVPPPTVAPTQAPPPTAAPTVPEVEVFEARCTLSEEIELESRLSLRQAINPEDNTLTMQLVFQGLGWIGLGFSQGGTMAGSNPVVIGVPDNTDTPVGFYSVGTSSAPNPQLTGTRNLEGATLRQTDDETILTFTMPVVQGSNPVAVAGETSRIIYAWGGNSLGIHSFRRSKEVTFTNCVPEGATSAPTPVPPPTPAPVPTSAPTVPRVESDPNGIITIGSSDILLTVDEDAGTMTAVVTYDGIGWVGFGASSDGNMVGGEVIIGIPGEDTPAKWTMSARSRGGIERRPKAVQTLLDASLEQTDTQTILTFTKLLKEDGEIEILATEPNTFIYAAGPDNVFDSRPHTERFSLKDVTIGSASVTAGGQLKQKMWAAHGFFMAVGWGLFVPLAIGSSMCRNILPLPAGMWFQLHFFFNSMAIIFTIIGFGVAVAAINAQQGSNATHFDSINHRKIGLAIFLFAVFQGGVAFFRPHPPAPPKKVDVEVDEENDAGNEDDHPEGKSKIRFLWEMKHRVFGLGLLALSWANVNSGFDRYAELFGDDVTAVFWGITGTVSGLVLVGSIYSKTKGQTHHKPSKQPDNTTNMAVGEVEA